MLTFPRFVYSEKASGNQTSESKHGNPGNQTKIFSSKRHRRRMSTASQVSSDIKSLELAELGKKRIEWANQSMKVLQIIRKEFIKNQPLKGIRISACLHVTAETANLAICLRDGGADVVLCAS
ncbi:MAG: adenosylhomocysteinase, partial [Candidatus Sulfotelmatobacter sp.]